MLDEASCHRCYRQQLTERWSWAKADLMARSFPCWCMSRAFCISVTSASRSEPDRHSTCRQAGVCVLS